MLGETVAARYGELPFLLKVLAAREPLSIQCHPNAEQARRGFARENAAGIPLDAIRPATTAIRTTSRSSSSPSPPSSPSRAFGLSRRSWRTSRRFASTGFGRAARSPRPRARWRRAEVALRRDPVARPRAHDRACSARPWPSGGPGAAWHWVARLHEKYPGDVGVLAPLFLNLVELQPEEAVFLGAGELHAYLEGTGLEIMANSDNVLRGGLTSKHVDVAGAARHRHLRSGSAADPAARDDRAPRAPLSHPRLGVRARAHRRLTREPLRLARGARSRDAPGGSRRGHPRRRRPRLVVGSGRVGVRSRRRPRVSARRRRPGLPRRRAEPRPQSRETVSPPSTTSTAPVE